MPPARKGAAQPAGLRRMSASHREPGARRAAGVPSATIGRRVARILALPAVVVLVLLAVVATQQIQGYRSSQATSRSVQLTLALQGLIHELQTERGVTAGVLGGNPSFKNELGPARTQVDARRTAVESLVDGGGSIEARVRTALQQLDGLPAVRSATDTAAAGRAAMFGYFTARIAALSTVDVGLDGASDDDLRQGTSALQSLADLSEATAQERAFLNGVFSAGGFGTGEYVQFAAMRTAKDAALARFRRFASPSENAAAAYVFDTGAARVTSYFEQIAVEAADGRHIVVNPQSWWSGLTTVLDDVRQLQQHVGSRIQIRAHDLETTATLRIAGLLAVVLLCFGGSVVLAALASRSITRPLAALAAEADAVASERLPSAVRTVQTGSEDDVPQPPESVKVPARATREIASVASALDRLQSAAYGLATEQATQRQRTIGSLANLGRRNQNLIRRQLGFITSLEQEEMDPTALANLFELDHLATRMRRNAASLLVLVGESGPRQWTSPVPIADVIRAAVSEVEEYRRIALRRVDDALVLGAAVGSVAHLLSELIENGLSFSPPESEVEVQGRSLGDSYLIAITDQGIGMSADDLRDANARLRGEGDFIAAPTRFLGHFVVGQLAREASIEVELVPSPLVGVTARVTLPASALSSRVAVEAAPAARTIAAQGSSVALMEGPGRLTARPLALAHVAGPEVDPSLDDVLPDPAPWAPWPGKPGESAWEHWSVTDPAAARAGGPAAYPAPPATSVPTPVPTSVPISVPAAATTNGGASPAVDRSTSPQPSSPTTQGSGPTLRLDPGQVDPGQLDLRQSDPGQPDHGHEADRTRNGLLKRTPRGQRPGEPAGAQPEQQRVIDLTAVRAGDVVDDSPAQVRSRLTSFRAGAERGRGGSTGTAPTGTASAGTTPAAAPAPWPTGSDHVAEDSE